MVQNFSNQDPYVKRVELSLLIDNPVTILNLATGGSIGTAPTTVDIASAIYINQTTAGQTITLPNPTVLAAGKVEFPVYNIGSTSFVILGTTLAPNSGLLVNWTGGAYAVIGTSSAASTVTVAGGKSFTVNNTLTLAGTDGTTMTFPSTSATVARTDAANTFTGTQTIGALVATTVNGNTFTTGTATLTGAAGKTLTFSNTLTLAGTDATVLTFPTTNATIARTDSAQTFTGVQTFSSTPVITHLTVEGVTSTGATGTGEFVFQTSPTLITPVLGVATGTSLAVTGLVTSSSPTANIGFATGAGGAVTQATNKSTGVTLNTNCGVITTNNASLAGAATVSFTLTNSTIGVNDVVNVSVQSGAATGLYNAFVSATGAGSCQISVTNLGATAGEVILINFVRKHSVAA